MDKPAVLKCHRCGIRIRDYNAKMALKGVSCPKCGSGKGVDFSEEFGGKVCEEVAEQKTGGAVRHDDEPLGKHVGKGSAKFKKPPRKK